MGKNKKRFYAVAHGRKPGIYDEWYGENGAEAQVKGVSDARYEGFSTFKEAKTWLREFKQPEPKQRSLFPASEIAEISPKQPEPEPPDEKRDANRKVKKDKVIIYTDGGCMNNPGPGGYGAVLMAGKKRKELSGGFQLTTNNRMELTACIEGLKTLKYPCSVALFSDSRYVVNGIEKGWAKRWRKKGWMRNAIEPAENADLWEQLLDLCDIHDVRFKWVKGHAGNRENERCDQLSKQAAGNKKKHARDIAYETGQTTVTPTLK
jgi:ribonuclease HI